MSEFFPGVPQIEYEGPQSKNPLAFKHYNPDEVVEDIEDAVTDLSEEPSAVVSSETPSAASSASSAEVSSSAP